MQINIERMFSPNFQLVVGEEESIQSMNMKIYRIISITPDEQRLMLQGAHSGRTRPTLTTNSRRGAFHLVYWLESMDENIVSRYQFCYLCFQDMIIECSCMFMHNYIGQINVDLPSPFFKGGIWGLIITNQYSLAFQKYSFITS